MVDFKYSDPKSQTIDESDPLSIKWRVGTMIGIFFFILPLNLQRSLGSLRYFSIAILLVVFGTIALSIAQSPIYYMKFKDSDDYKVDLYYSTPSLKWLQGLATMMLSFNCQITFFYVRAEMVHKTKRRVRKVIRNLITVEVLFYMLIAISGYFSLGSKLLPAIYTLRRKLSKSKLNF